MINVDRLFIRAHRRINPGMTNRLELFLVPKWCSLVPNIVLHELGIDFELTFVHPTTKVTAKGDDFHAIHPLGYVPALRLEDGTVLGETATIVRYLADAYPERRLAPEPGTQERLRLEELLVFIATELHKGVAPFTIMRNPSEDSKAWAAERLAARIDLLERKLGERPFFVGDRFTIADAYAFWAIRNAAILAKRKLSPQLRAFIERVGARPAVLAAEAAERRRS